MTLDFAILDDDGAIAKEVCVGVAAHHELIEAAKKLAPSGVLLRASEYYEDADFPSSDLPEAMGELRRAQLSGQISEDTRHVIDRLLDLITEAQRSNRAVVAIAD